MSVSATQVLRPRGIGIEGIAEHRAKVVVETAGAWLPAPRWQCAASRPLVGNSGVPLT